MKQTKVLYAWRWKIDDEWNLCELNGSKDVEHMKKYSNLIENSEYCKDIMLSFTKRTKFNIVKLFAVGYIM